MRIAIARCDGFRLSGCSIPNSRRCASAASCAHFARARTARETATASVRRTYCSFAIRGADCRRSRARKSCARVETGASTRACCCYAEKFL